MQPTFGLMWSLMWSSHFAVTSVLLVLLLHTTNSTPSTHGVSFVGFGGDVLLRKLWTPLLSAQKHQAFGSSLLSVQRTFGGKCQDRSRLSALQCASRAASPQIPDPAAKTKGEQAPSVLIQHATNPEEVLAATTKLPLPGEEAQHWQHQLIHRQKRQSASSAALLRLSKMLVGQGMEEERQRVLLDPRFARLCQLAAAGARGSEEHAAEEEASKKGKEEESRRSKEAKMACQALRSLAVFSPSSSPSSSSSSSSVAPALLSLSGIVAAGLDQLSCYEVTGAAWAARRLGVEGEARDLLQQASEGQRLPFSLEEGLLADVVDFEQMRQDIEFNFDAITTRTGKVVTERRGTVWMALPGIGGLAYSGKLMPPTPFSPSVEAARTALGERLNLWYDCCLVNLYEDGDAACNWHTDPDHGSKWALDEVVVSVGETRRFNLRELQGAAGGGDGHSFHVFEGDVMRMYRDCQERFEHCVKSSEGAGNQGGRISLVGSYAIGSYTSGMRCPVLTYRLWYCQVFKRALLQSG